MVEVLTYRFEVRGVMAGRNVVRKKRQGSLILEESDATFEGPLGSAQVQQQSRWDPTSGRSLEFHESSKDRHGERKVDIAFDEQLGLVSLRRGSEVAEVPYVETFRDPLAMLSQIRLADPEAERLRIPMLGKTVEAHALGETELVTPVGTKRTRAFQLFPGGSWIWVDTAAPHAIVKMTQRTDEGYVDAWLVEVSEASDMPAWDGMSRGGSKRKRRGRRKRGGRSRSKKRE